VPADGSPRSSPDTISSRWLQHGAPSGRQERLTDPKTMALAVTMMEVPRPQFPRLMSLESRGQTRSQPFMGARPRCRSSTATAWGAPSPRPRYELRHPRPAHVPLTLADGATTAVVVARAASGSGWSLSRKACVRWAPSPPLQGPRTGKEIKGVRILGPPPRPSARPGGAGWRRPPRSDRRGAEVADGIKIFAGRSTTIRPPAPPKGFLRGTATIEGLPTTSGHSVRLAFQNEFAVGWLDGDRGS